MKIYTYHEYVPEIPNGHKLLDLWKQCWENAGWTPIILNRSHAEQHPNYNEFLCKYQKLPTVNPSRYELACYLRWLAMAVVGGGWMSDSDVIPYCFAPYTPPEDLTFWSYGKSIVPCLVSGNSEHYTCVAKIFAEWEGQTNLENGRPHASDQNILQTIDKFYNRIPLCVEYGELGWDSFPIVHYPSGTMQNHQPREKHIPLLRKLQPY
jgi:hypothetical protein